MCEEGLVKRRTSPTDYKEKTHSSAKGELSMREDNTNAQRRIWHESAHASLCVEGAYVDRTHFFKP